MSDFRDAITSGVSSGFNNFKNPLTKRNQAGSNFLNAFLGSGALQFNDDSGSVSLDPRTGAFNASPKNPSGIGFTFNPLMQSASIRKGPFELSGGLGDAPIGASAGYGPTNEEMYRKFTSNGKTPWGMIGFRFGGNKQEQEQEFSSEPEDSMPKGRQFVNPEVKALLDRTTSPFNSGRDLYNPSSW